MYIQPLNSPTAYAVPHVFKDGKDTSTQEDIYSLTKIFLDFMDSLRTNREDFLFWFNVFKVEVLYVLYPRVGHNEFDSSKMEFVILERLKADSGAELKVLYL